MIPNLKPAKKLIYLDNAATTPIDARVLQVMVKQYKNNYGNPSSIHKSGKEANKALAEARKTIAEILHCQTKEIVFTSGGTESANLAILGIAVHYLEKHGKPGHIITSAIEHPSVLKPIEQLGKQGWNISYLAVDKEGVIDFKQLQSSLKPNTALISIMHANNEIGTIQPIAKIGKWLFGQNKIRALTKKQKVYFHTDACQTAGNLVLDIGKLGIDLLTLNGSKIYGPKNSGLLFIRSGTEILPLLLGGGQERGVRSGTEDVAAASGLAEALSISQRSSVQQGQKLADLRDWLHNELIKLIPGAVVNGPDCAEINRYELNRLPNNLNFSFPGVDGEALMLYLDSYNICVSTGSACSSTNPEPSKVILAISGNDKQRADSSIRITLGKQTTKTELKYLCQVLPGLVEVLKTRS